MVPLQFPDPPTAETLADARRSLVTTRESVSQLTSKIDAAEASLAQLVKESKCAISEMETRRALLKNMEQKTLAYLSPIRRLPTELLRDVFLWNFEDYSCCAWVLAAVCSSWRRLSLSMPRIWSKVSHQSFRYCCGGPSCSVLWLCCKPSSWNTGRQNGMFQTAVDLMRENGEYAFRFMYSQTDGTFPSHSAPRHIGFVFHCTDASTSIDSAGDDPASIGGHHTLMAGTLRGHRTP